MPPAHPLTAKLETHTEELNLLISTWLAKQELLLAQISTLSSVDSNKKEWRETENAFAEKFIQIWELPQSSNAVAGTAEGEECLEQHWSCNAKEQSGEEATVACPLDTGVAVEGNFTKSDKEVEIDRKLAAPLASDEHLGFGSDRSVSRISGVSGMSRRQSERILVHLSHFSNIVVIYNTVIITAATEYAMSHPEANPLPFLRYSELACMIYYTFEIAIRVCVERISFFTGRERIWNLFDLGLVLQGLWEQVEKFVFKDMAGSANLSFLRMLRLLKTLKLLRLVRILRSFRELRLIVSSVMGSIKAFAWALVLMVTVCFMFGVCIMQSCSIYVAEHVGTDNLKVQSALQDISKNWSTISKSMQALFMASTGGVDWDTLSSPLEEVGIHIYGIFLFFIALYHFVLMNVISSIFIEAMMNNAVEDSQLVIQTQMEQREAFMHQLHSLWSMIDQEGSGMVSYDEFIGAIESPELAAFARSLELEISEAKYFFKALSDSGRRPVDIETFVDGCIKLKGMARSVDLTELIFEHKASQRNLEEFMLTFDTWSKAVRQEQSILIKYAEAAAQFGATQRSSREEAGAGMDEM